MGRFPPPAPGHPRGTAGRRCRHRTPHGPALARVRNHSGGRPHARGSRPAGGGDCARAFRSLEGWEAFHVITRHPKLTATRTWTTANDALVVSQAGVREFLPDHHSTAALDAHLGTVRDYLDSRSFVLRNRDRTTLLLGLIRLHLNGTDNPRGYAELLRASLDANGGHGPRQRRKYDTGTSRRVPRELRQPESLRT